MRSVLDLTNSTAGKIPQLVVTGIVIIALTGVFARANSAQCVAHPDKKSAVKFNNETSFELTFFVDEDEEGVVVASRSDSNELEVEPGEHLLRARAVVGGEAFWVWVVNEIRAGQVCTWTVTDPAHRTAAENKNYRAGIAVVSKRKGITSKQREGRSLNRREGKGEKQ